MSAALFLRRQLRTSHVTKRIGPGSYVGDPQRRRFTVLALESSADDTCAAVVTSDRQILSNIVLKQLDKHEAFGGIEPYIAIQEHQRNMPLAVKKSLEKSGLNMSHIDGIAFTRGPGMSGCLSVCSNAAKTLAAALRKPLIGVHHMQAHALTARLTSTPPPRFPFLTLLVSGGHTMIVLAFSHTRFKILANTRDEAIGRTIDKVARDLRLQWKGRAPGAALEAFCRDGDGVLDMESVVRDMPNIKPFEVPMRGQMEFSFSGLHSSVDRYFAAHGQHCDEGMGRSKASKAKYTLPAPHMLALARTFQSSALAQLVEKVVLALQWCEEHKHELLSPEGNNGSFGIKDLVISGGVASSMTFREVLTSRLQQDPLGKNVSAIFPPAFLCTDNAAMIAWASMHRFLKGESDPYSIDHLAHWSIEDNL